MQLQLITLIKKVVLHLRDEEMSLSHTRIIETLLFSSGTT